MSGLHPRLTFTATTILIVVAFAIGLLVAWQPMPSANAQNTLDCPDFPSQAAAQAELRRDPSDPHGLDGPPGPASSGIPGVACEDLPPPRDLTPVLPGETTGPGGSEGCANPRQVRTFTGSQNQITPTFNITGNTFRVSYSITDLDNDPAFDSFLVRPRENELGIGQSILVFDPGSGSENMLAGPGTFDLEIQSEGFQYTVTVEDCITSGGNNNNGNNNRQNKKHRQNRRHNIGNGIRQYNPFNPNRQYSPNNGIFNEDPENNNSNNQNNNPSADSGAQQPASGGNNPSDAGVSASSGPGEASAQAGGVTANADNLPPVSRQQGSVVNEIPTQGPLPNTGGAPLFWALPLIGLLVVTGLPLYRWVRRRA